MSQIGVILQELVVRERETRKTVFSKRANGRCRWNKDKAEEFKRTAAIKRDWSLFEFCLGFLVRVVVGL